MAVLHIVLMILKIIGILLLILLGIFLLTVLGVLFCPVRYSAQGYKDENKYGGKAKVSWLCHLVSFSVWYDSSQGEAGYGVRIFGIPLLKVLEELSKRKEKKKKKAKAAKVQAAEREGREIPEQDKASEEKTSKESSEAKEALEEKGSRKEQRGEDFRQTEGKAQRLLGKVKAIFQIPGKIFEAFRKFQLTAKGICDKIRKIINFLESEKFKRGMCLILQEGKKMLAHVKPRKIEGRIKFGTEDPCLTGEILGAAGIFYPLYGENFSIEPCFDQTVLEGTISLKGRMYGIVLLISAVKILRSRDIRYIIRHFN